MKIRNGFVSNSSSSSFALIGEKTTLNKIDPKSFDRGAKYLAEMEDFDYGEGQICIYIEDTDVLDFLKKNGHVGKVWEIFAEAGDGETDISNIKIPKGRKAILTSFTIDQSSPSSIEEVREAFEGAELL